RADFPVAALAALAALGISRCLPGGKGCARYHGVRANSADDEGLVQPLTRLGTRPGAALLDHPLEPALEPVELDATDAEPLGAARRAAGQLDLRGPDAEGLGEERAALLVGAPALRRRGHAHLE